MESYFVGKDIWFSANWEAKISNPFAVWWRRHYGLPEDYSNDEDNLHEYFVRMAFAFMGWQAAQHGAQRTAETDEPDLSIPWRCHCETINAHDDVMCKACGQPKPYANR